MPKFSIIIPVYNVEEYVEECLISVINQTNQDFEIIVVNDGATDNSLKIVEKVKQQNPDIEFSILTKKNGGLSSARNYGYNHAKGDYIYFLDSDDYIREDFIEIILKNFEKDLEIEVCTFDAKQFVETEFKFVIHDANRYVRSFSGVTEKVYRGLEFFDVQIKTNTWISGVPLHAYRKSFLDKHNLAFKEGIIHEDEIYTFEVCQKARKIQYISEALYKRRYRPTSIMTNTNVEKRLKSIVYIIEEVSHNYVVKGNVKIYIIILMKAVINTDFKKAIKSIKIKNTNIKFWLWLTLKYPLVQLKKVMK